MIDKSHELPVTRGRVARHLALECLLPAANGAGRDLALMRRIDEWHLNYPFAGARMLREMHRLEGITVGRLHVRTLMEKMGIAAI